VPGFLPFPQPDNEHDQQDDNDHAHYGQAAWEDSRFLHGMSISGVQGQCRFFSGAVNNAGISLDGKL
jgi:hypothetical protein